MPLCRPFLYTCIAGVYIREIRGGGGGRCYVRSENAQFGSLYTVLLITCGVVWLEEMSVAAASLVSTRCFSSILIKVMFSFFPHTMTVL